MNRNKFLTGLGIAIIAFAIGYLGGNVIPVKAPLWVGFDTTAIILANERAVECQLIRMDIEVVGEQIGLSERQQTDYVQFVEAATAKYKLPPILLHAIVSVESGYDPSAVHPSIFIKGKTTRAVGLTGVVWEYHGDSLKVEKVAFSRLELTEPRINLMASAYILHKYIVDIIKENPKIAENRLFDELIKRYYGAYDTAYKDRMYARIKETASKQWINRVVQSIFTEYKPKPTITDIKVTK